MLIAILSIIGEFLFFIIDIRLLILEIYYFILRLVILHSLKIQNVLVSFIVVYFTLKNVEVVYCMDAKTEMTLALQDKISKLQERVVDFQEQVEAAQSGLDTILREKA